MIVVVESPCAPQPGAVEKLIAQLADWERTVDLRDEIEDTLGGEEEWWFADGICKKDMKAFVRLRNTYYARAAMLDCLLRGEAPYLSHLLYTQVLDDDAEQRERGMHAGAKLTRRLFDLGAVHVFYTQLGFSDGMKAAQKLLSSRTEHRKLGDEARAWYLARVPASIAWLV